jgi:hypothetical protein
MVFDVGELNLLLENVKLNMRFFIFKKTITKDTYDHID